MAGGVARDGDGGAAPAGPAAARPALAADAGLVRAVGAVPVDRQRRAAVLRLRLGVAAAGGRRPRRLPRTGRHRPADPGRPPGAVAAVPGRVRRRADQDPRRRLLAEPDLPPLPPRDPADARPVQLVLPPPARRRCTGSRWRPTTSPSSSCRGCSSRRSRSPAWPAPSSSSPSCGWWSRATSPGSTSLTITLALFAFDNALAAGAARRPAARCAPAPTWYAVVVIGRHGRWSSCSATGRRATCCRRRQAMNASFNRWHLVNAYGAFGSVTRERHEIVVEGTADADARAGHRLARVRVQGQAGRPGRRPRQCGAVPPPPRLADVVRGAVARATPTAGSSAFLRRLLEGDRATLRLLRHNPFPDEPPAFVRARLYRYRFTTRDERARTPAVRAGTGLWRTRAAAWPGHRRRAVGGRQNTRQLHGDGATNRTTSRGGGGCAPQPGQAVSCPTSP